MLMAGEHGQLATFALPWQTPAWDAAFDHLSAQNCKISRKLTQLASSSRFQYTRDQHGHTGWYQTYALSQNLTKWDKTHLSTYMMLMPVQIWMINGCRT